MQTSPSISQALVSSAEQLTKLLSTTLTNNITEAIKAKPNIGNYSRITVVVFVLYHIYVFTVLKAERVSNATLVKGYIFPDEEDNLTAYTGGTAQVMVPSGLLQNICK